MALLLGSAIATAMYLDAKFAIRSDLVQIQSMLRMQKFIRERYDTHGEDDWSFYHILHSTYPLRETQGNSEAFLFEGRSWSYNAFRAEIGRIAEWFVKLGVRNRTVVGLFINNSPEFMFVWWALLKIGAIPAPINTGLTGEYIRHCVKICGANVLVCSLELYDTVVKTFWDGSESEVEAKTTSNDLGCSSIGHPSVPRLEQVVLYDYDTYSNPSELTSLPRGMVSLKHDELPPATPESSDFQISTRPKISPTCALVYLFTSGTTGLPKAATWPAGYSFLATCPGRWPGMQDVYRRFYICLPMFHGTALFAQMPATLASSGTVIFARRFSRREFWADCRRTKANAIVYIGEMLRYLVQSPPDPRFPDEKGHGVELAYGLGLAPSVWRDFRDRFGVPWIVGYYSSTESTTGLMNSNKNNLGIGKVARWGPLMRSRWFGQNAFYIVRADFETGDILRDPKTGFCIKCRPDEVGESICRVIPPLQRKHDYIGEEGMEATDKKTIRHVFEKGDEFFRLGDAMTIDKEGFVSFNDRLGDTYRAKGHNISTTEVESAMSRHPSIISVNVYGIPVNRYGYDGQLGCAAITLQSIEPGSESTIVSGLERWLRESESALPAYAVPRFLRVLIADGEHSAQDSTHGHASGEQVSAIMKKLKVELRKQGFSPPPESKDRMYWIEREGSGYIPLVKAAEQALLSGQAQL